MSFSYIVREGFSGFSRTKLAAAGSITTIIITLLFLGVYYIISTNASRIVEGIRGKVEMEVFLDEPVTPKRIEEIRTSLSGIQGVQAVQFISKEDAAKIFKQEFGEDVTTVLDFNPLPPSFKLTLREEYRTTEAADGIKTKALAIRGTDKVVYRRDILEFIEKQADTFRTVGLVLGCVVSLSAIFLVSNTIRLTIHAKRKNLHAMKLVGASRWFVRAPFLLEGLLQGLFGGAIAAGIIYYVLVLAGAALSEQLLMFVRIDPSFYILLLAAGLLLGLFGSAISVRKYIRDTIDIM